LIAYQIINNCPAREKTNFLRYLFKDVFVRYQPTKHRRLIFETDLLVCARRQQVCLVRYWRMVRRFLGYSTCEIPVQLKVLHSIRGVWKKSWIANRLHLERGGLGLLQL